MGCEIHAEQWGAIMLTTGRGKNEGDYIGTYLKISEGGGKLTRPTIQTPEIRGFTGELINENTRQNRRGFQSILTSCNIL